MLVKIFCLVPEEGPLNGSSTVCMVEVFIDNRVMNMVGTNLMD